MNIELFHFPLMRMRKTLELTKVLLRKPQENFDTEILKNLRKLQHWAKKLSYKINVYCPRVGKLDWLCVSIV